ncbi:uncharacterized protein LOC129848980 [Salvelinus fontinalis]|uniref:uncharacterized protein LOC129848980 n=1 Tax=Salvelinus fontinalis TaxID=8038 RepID=UPI002485F807|nr:uncharacterized protein LOC129848980 [Salvelinus fontinalis]
MSTSATSQSAAAGLKNTLRFQWTGNDSLMERFRFGKEVLFGPLRLTADDVHCLQQNTPEKFYDVSFYTITRLEEVRGLFRANATAPALSAFQVESLCRHNMRVLTVHMFNPWVTEETLVCYLSRYVTILPGVRDIKDALGIWTGKRQFRVLLKEDESGHDGYRHPPASFSIGADRGYLMYAGQPRFCRKCSTYGHLADACTQTRCRNCGTLGHIMRDCTVPKRCSLCNSEDHLFRHCPKAAPSYARAVSGKRAESDKRPESGKIPDEGEGMELRAIEEVVEELVMERELRGSEESGSETPSSSHEESGETDGSWNKQVEGEKGEPTAPSAQESWTTVRERRKCSVKRKQMSPVSPLISMEATEKSALGGNRFSVLESGRSEEKGEGNPGSAEETLLSPSGSSIDSSGLAPSGVPAPTQMEEERVFPTKILVDSPPAGDHRFPDRPPNEEMYLKFII